MTDSVTVSDDDYNELFRLDKAVEAFGTGPIDDPYPVFAELLAQGPVHKGTLSECMGLPAERSGRVYVPGKTYYSVFSFQAVSDVFTRREDFNSEFYYDIGVDKSFGDTILNMDGLKHRRYRDLIQPLFQPAFAADWWKNRVISGLIDELVGAFEKDGRADLNAQFFSRLPLRTITTGFGMTVDEGIAFRQQMHQVLHVGTSQAETASAFDELGLVIYRVIRERQAEPRDDIISKLAHADLKEEDGSTRKLTVEEVAAFCRLILTAGADTTWRQLGTAFYALLNHPDQLAAVIADRSLLGDAILEATRWYPPDPVFPRTVARDTVLHGVELPKGAVLHLCIYSANRDPSRWPDPDKFDIYRPVQRSVAFAAGAHSCLGQHLARQEMTLALNALFDRFPNIRWDPSQPQAEMVGGLMQRGPTALHVLLG
jgi:cytochrome P450